MENINIFAVFVAALAQFVIGGLWYSPVLFANTWLAALGKTPGSMQGMSKKQYIAFGMSFIGSLLMANVLAHVIDAFDGVSAGAGIAGGLWMWLGFISPVLLNNFVYDGGLRTGENRKHLFLINGGYYLVSLVVMGIILALWR